MNKFRVKGKVQYIKKIDTKNNTFMITFQISYKWGNEYMNIPCQTFHTSFAELKEGDYLELIEYVPQSRSYIDESTGKKIKQVYLYVLEAELTEYSGSGFINRIVNSAKPIGKVHMENKFDYSKLEKEEDNPEEVTSIDHLKETGTLEVTQNEAEDQVPLDWLDEMEKE